MLDVSRAEFDDAIDSAAIRELIRLPTLEVLQTAKPVSDRAWERIDAELCPARPEVTLRVYGHYSTVCDLRFTRRLRRVRRFSADCLMRATSVECLAEMRQLDSLSIGIFDLQDFSVLDRITDKLTRLSLSATRSRKPSLGPVARQSSLRELYVEGHHRHIEALSSLHDLVDLTLRSITTPDLAYLEPLEKLASLDIKLGGIRDFIGVAGKQSLRYLELWQIRDLPGADVIGTLPGLQNLFLQSLPHVESLPSLERSSGLRRIVLENLKGMQRFDVLERAPALEEFALVDGRNQQPSQLEPLLQNPRLERVSAHFGSIRRNEEFSRLRERSGKAEWLERAPFVYR